ncbi:MAG: Ppx/GppA family phosphatase [Armatimonadetes bacterium]|nr:Ppx/GppA family phosphatase [Armatimonadota bacterium]MDE2206443.1 Ppx/GppA family phosphatase [Armatimonadota bacterium]
MTPPAKAKAPLRVLAALDVGTNAIRLEVARVTGNIATPTLSYQREMVRMGDQEFGHGRLTPAALERGALVCARFADVARGFGADEIIALATSAVREAANRDEFIERVRQEAHLDVRVISGPEEARLCYLGVVSAADLGTETALFGDVGGGSTEIIVGDAVRYHELESVRTGSIRLTNAWVRGSKGPVSRETFNQMKGEARALVAPVVRKMREHHPFSRFYCSGGSATNLAQVTARRRGDPPASINNYTASYGDLRDASEMLCRLNLSERREAPGLEPDRADLILGGAAILLTLLEEAQTNALTVSTRGLRHGILVDRLLREQGDTDGASAPPLRVESILRLCRACQFDEPHARHISFLAERLFDDLCRLGYHQYGERERELLHYASLTHDIGCFLSHSNHQRHAWYLVRNSDLLGFTDSEIALIANVSLYHRRAMPKRSHPGMQGLDGDEVRQVKVLSAILRIAEALDRSHLALISQLRLTPSRNPDTLTVTAVTHESCELEKWSFASSKDLFERVFHTALALRFEAPAGVAEPVRP